MTASQTTNAEAPIAGARVVVSRVEVDKAFARLAAGIQPAVAAEPCLLLGVMLGGLLPLARLTMALNGRFMVDVCRLSRYGDAKRGGVARWLAPPVLEIRDRHVILVDDIFDEGVTLDFVRDHCRRAGARKVSTVVLVRKRHTRAIGASGPDHFGLEVGDEYVFGCGMDYQGSFRHLPDIWALGG